MEADEGKHRSNPRSVTWTIWRGSIKENYKEEYPWIQDQLREAEIQGLGNNFNTFREETEDKVNEKKEKTEAEFNQKKKMF